MNRAAGIVIALALLGLLGTLLAWGGLGYDHQLVIRWSVTSDNSHFFAKKSVGSYRHTRESVYVLAVVLGVLWTCIASMAAMFMRWAWKGYPGW